MTISASRLARAGSICSRTSGKPVPDTEDRALAEIMLEFWTARLHKELTLPTPDSFAVAQINKRLDELRPATGNAA